MARKRYTKAERIRKKELMYWLPILWMGGKTISANIKPDSNVDIEYLRELTMAGDFATLFNLLPANNWSKTPLGKFRFEWGSDGKPRYVPFTRNDMINFFNGQWIWSDPMHGGKCPEKDIRHFIEVHYANALKSAQKYPDTNPLHINEMIPPSFKCKKPRIPHMTKVKKQVVIAVAAVAVAYLGPAMMDKISIAFGGAVEGTAAGTAAGTATQATTFSKIKAAVNSVLKYVNKARTIKAVVNGEMPPPPIGITGSTFTEWAMAVAKEEIKKATIEKAIEKGVEYIQKKMTAKEEAKLRAEIEAMQRELARITPADTPMQPMIEVPKQIQIKMVEEKTRSKELNNTVAIAIPLGLAYLAFS